MPSSKDPGIALVLDATGACLIIYFKMQRGLGMIAQGLPGLLDAPAEGGDSQAGANASGPSRLDVDLGPPHVTRLDLLAGQVALFVGVRVDQHETLEPAQPREVGHQVGPDHADADQDDHRDPSDSPGVHQRFSGQKRNPWSMAVGCLQFAQPSNSVQQVRPSSGDS